MTDSFMEKLARAQVIKEEMEKKPPDFRTSEAEIIAPDPDVLKPETEARTSEADIRTSGLPPSDAKLSGLPGIRTSGVLPDYGEEKGGVSASTQLERTWKSRKDKVHLTTRIDEGLYDALVGLANLLSANIKDVVSEALQDIVFKYTGVRASGGQDFRTSGLPDLPLKELTNLEIRNLYLQVSNHPITTRDRKLIEQAFATYHPLLIELGIRESARSARENGNTITSFKYCLNAMTWRAEWELKDVVNELAKLRAGN